MSHTTHEPVLTAEELQIEKDFEAGHYKPVPNQKKRILQLQKIALKSVQSKKSTPISIQRKKSFLATVKKEQTKKHVLY